MKLRRWTLRYTAALVAITVATIAVGTVLWTSEEVKQIDTEPGLPCSNWCIGSEDAPIVIEAFPDFECGQCVEKERFAVLAVTIFPGDVRFVYSPFPYSDFGFKIAEALEAAGEQGKFWELHNLLMENVPDNVEELYAFVEETGLDMNMFSEAMNSHKHAANIDAAMDEAISRGVHDVALFINGIEYRKYPGTFEDMRQSIAEELEAMGADGTE